MTPTQADIDRSIEFLKGLGFSIRFAPVPETFLPGISIAGGIVTIDFDKADRQAILADLFHESGHIAVIPSRFRPMLQTDILDIHQHYDQVLDEASGDEGLMMAIIHSGEQEATAWSYAAAHAAGIDTRLVFVEHPNVFRSKGPRIHLDLSRGAFGGIHGLAAGGMTLLPSPANRMRGLTDKMYPAMTRWLQN